MKKLISIVSLLFIAQSQTINATSTDISDKENVIYMSPVTVTPGTKQVLSINMKNTADIRGFQFDLYLPEGITVAKTAKGKIIGSLSAPRLPEEDEHTLTIGEQGDGAIRFLCGSLADETFTGNDGEIATLTVNIAENMVAGDYIVSFKAMRLSETDISKYYDTDLIEATITVGGAVDSRIILDEASDKAPEAANDVDVLLKRTLNANFWSTIVLPFTVTGSQVKEAFGDDVELASFTAWKSVTDDDDAITEIDVTFTAADAADGIQANTPMLIKVTKNIESASFDDVTLEPTEKPMVQVGTTKKTRGTFYGTYTKMLVPEETVFINENKFWYSTGKTNMKGFRGYFEFYDVLDAYYTDGALVKYNFYLDSHATGLKTISESNENERIYDLSGRCVEKAGKGIYIINNKKVLVK